MTTLCLFTAVCGTMWVVAFPVMVFMTAVLSSPVDQKDMRSHPTLCVLAKMPPKTSSSKQQEKYKSREELENYENEENDGLMKEFNVAFV